VPRLDKACDLGSVPNPRESLDMVILDGVKADTIFKIEKSRQSTTQCNLSLSLESDGTH